MRSTDGHVGGHRLAGAHRGIGKGTGRVVAQIHRIARHHSAEATARGECRRCGRIVGLVVRCRARNGEGFLAHGIARSRACHIHTTCTTTRQDRHRGAVVGTSRFSRSKPCVHRCAAGNAYRTAITGTRTCRYFVSALRSDRDVSAQIAARCCEAHPGRCRSIGCGKCASKCYSIERGSQGGSVGRNTGRVVVIIHRVKFVVIRRSCREARITCTRAIADINDRIAPDSATTGRVRCSLGWSGERTVGTPHNHHPVTLRIQAPRQIDLRCRCRRRRLGGRIIEGTYCYLNAAI